ncbi:hypothetical protein [Stigmatella aurantiaca]|uniref:Uncharacterized protein n=1 Tax=Stigmatella aurantiaca (strain DW4/3-1) TaxID=378806 RepID=Q096C2_STIAD|nr:hypothetical protein [Stigmatella aurantiaca]ADO69494.1 uncharacterized protein STAUR_1690 [Stigmatella aurantiaca DW4/3-1]EAU67601.1 hypothetical protein STIAU_3799 [Stigmatella aurantiaca DW4/3-1]
MSLAPISSRKPVAPPPPVEQKNAVEKKPEQVVPPPEPKLAQTQAPLRQDQDTFEPAVQAKSLGARSMFVIPEGTPAEDVKRIQGTVAAGAKALESARASAETAKPQSVSGEELAKQEVDVKTAGDRRKDIEDTQRKLHEETTKKTDEVFAQADGSGFVPSGTEVKKLSDSEAELVRRNEKGDMLERTVATRGPDGAVSLDTSSYEEGVNRRDRVATKGDGSSRVQRAEWASETNEVAQPKSFEDIEKARDRNLTYTSNDVRYEEGRLKVDEYAQADGGIKGSRTSFYEQKGDKGIDNKLDRPFDYKKPVERTDTYSYTIPPPGEDGSQGHPQYNRTQTFSQDGVQATSYVDRELDGHTKYAGEGPHNREDVDRVRDEYSQHGGEDYDANEGKPPKRWLMELQTGPDQMQAQTFIEGTPSATIKTTKSREGSTVRESYEGKTFKPDAKDAGDLADVKGESSRTYAQDGSIEKMDATSTEADGSSMEQHYNSTRKATDAGLELNESLETKRTKDGKTDTSLREDTSLLSGKGAQLVNSRNTVTASDGRQAVHELGKGGERMTLSGPEGQDPRDISDPEALKDDPAGKDLLLQAGIATSSTVSSYMNNGGAKSLEMLGELGKDAHRLPSLASKVLGNDTLLQGLEGARGGVAALGGAAGAVAGGMELAEGIRKKNVPEIFKGLFDTGMGLTNMYQGGKAFFDAIKGVTATAKDATGTVAKGMGNWASVLGNTKVAGAVTSSVLNSVKGMGGLGKVAGAAAEMGAKGLSALKSMGGFMNVAGAAVGTGLGIMDIVGGAKGKDGAQIAKGAVGVAGSIGGAIAAGAIGGPLGMAVGLGIGLLTFGFGKLMDLISDKKHKIAELQIG